MRRSYREQGEGMSPKSILTSIFLSMAMMALAGGIARLEVVDWPVWAFAAFFVLFRTKEFLDDVEYFKEVQTTEWDFKAGFFFGVISWFFWILSAAQLGNLAGACRYLWIGFIVSTGWTLLVAFKRGFQRKYVCWLATNPVYISVLVYASFQEGPDARQHIGICYLCLLPVAMADFFISRSHYGLEEL